MRTYPTKSGSTDLGPDCNWLSHNFLLTLERTHEVLAGCSLAGMKVEVYVPILLQESARALRIKMLTSASSPLGHSAFGTVDGIIAESMLPRLVERLRSGCCGPCVVVYDHKTFNVLGD